jgi:pyruvate/2-oxoglutarate dehydrogenase complex dihydrolipoamide dehydrogenase (E3) component
VPPEVLELCDGVDVLIHDAQHTREEYEPKRHWGHCTIDYAVLVAHEAGARNLVLFHHDPVHGDDEMDRIGREAGELGASLGVPLDRAGRIIVEPDCRVPGHPEIFVIGDLAYFAPVGGTPLPGLAPVAMQQGRHVA